MIAQFGTPQFGQVSFGGGDAFVSSAIIGLFVALLGDPSSHGGSITTSGQDGKCTVKGTAVAVNGGQHSCPIPGHGVTSITAITTKSKINSKLIATYGATAGCGALILPPNRKVTVEK